MTSTHCSRYSVLHNDRAGVQSTGVQGSREKERKKNRRKDGRRMRAEEEDSAVHFPDSASLAGRNIEVTRPKNSPGAEEATAGREI